MRHHLTQTPTALALALATVVLTSFAACSSADSDDNVSCTLIGCIDQVTLRSLDSSGAVIAKVQGTVIAGDKIIAINCLSGTGGPDYVCSPTGLSIHTSAASLTISLASGDLAVSDLVVTPTYATSRPNGPKCDPVCKQAVVDVQLGGGLVDAVSTDGSVSNDSAGSDGASSDVDLDDAVSSDAGVSDAGVTDAGTADSAAQDTTSADTVSLDTASPDAGTTDAATTDAGSVAPGCCNTAANCAKGNVCAGSVCKDSTQLKTGECWVDGDCDGGTCKSPNVCPCGASCFAPDNPGSCSNAATCSKLDPNGYGLCEMVLGVGWDGTKCVTISGCGCKEDCAKIFKDKAACDAACTTKS